MQRRMRPPAPPPCQRCCFLPANVALDPWHTQEGVYRHVNGRLITHAEEIAFYGGNAKEKAVLSAAFADLVALVRRSQQVRCAPLSH
jgi:ABC transporter transmembrane region 2